MRLLSAPGIRLKRTLSLHAVLRLEKSSFGFTGNSNSSRRTSGLSKNPVRWSCVTFAGALRSAGVWRRAIRFLPQDFHNCGKHCGKRVPQTRMTENTPNFWSFLRGESMNVLVFRPFLPCLGLISGPYAGSDEAKVMRFSVC